MITQTALKKNLSIIFGEDTRFSDISAVQHIDEETLKRAYRKKAFHFHPDRAPVVKLSESNLTRLFQTLSAAYAYVLPVVNGQKDINHLLVSTRHQGNNSPAYNHGTRVTSQKPFKSKTWFSGKLPQRPLRFAQFLYYNRLICWQTLIDALTWQIINRPKIGEIGLKGNFLQEGDIQNILKNRSLYDKFGQTALKYDFLKPHDLKAILGYQKRLNYPIGRYFLENSIVSRPELYKLLNHNKRFNYKQS